MRISSPAQESSSTIARKRAVISKGPGILKVPIPSRVRDVPHNARTEASASECKPAYRGSNISVFPRWEKPMKYRL